MILILLIYRSLFYGVGESGNREGIELPVYTTRFKLLGGHSDPISQFVNSFEHFVHWYAE